MLPIFKNFQTTSFFKAFVLNAVVAALIATLTIELRLNLNKEESNSYSFAKKLFNREKIFPQTFAQLISVGEQTGSLDDMFGSIARYYEEEFDVAVTNLSSLIEPIMIVFMGATIGGLMVAMYAPIFNVGALIK